MTLKDFAVKAGYISIQCDKTEWGGSWGYMIKEYPNVRYCGYRTEKKAIEGFLVSHFGEDSLKAITALIKENERLKAKLRGGNREYTRLREHL